MNKMEFKDFFLAWVGTINEDLTRMCSGIEKEARDGNITPPEKEMYYMDIKRVQAEISALKFDLEYGIDKIKGDERLKQFFKLKK